MSAYPHIQSRQCFAFLCLALLATGSLLILASRLTSPIADKPAIKPKSAPTIPEPLNRFVTAKGRRIFIESSFVSCDVNSNGQDVKIVHAAPEGTQVEVGDVILELDSSSLVKERTEQTALVESLRANLSQSRQTDTGVQTVQAQLDIEEQTLQALEVEISKCKIRAPIAGRVLYGFRPYFQFVDRKSIAALEDRPQGGLIVIPNGNVRPRQVIVSAISTRETLVRALVKEGDVMLVRPGMSVALRVVDRPDLTTTGKVEKVNKYAEPGGLSPIRQYAVQISAVDTDHKLRSDMTIDVQILVGPDRNSVRSRKEAFHGRRQDEAGTPYRITVDGQTLTDGTVTVRDRDTLKQDRIHERELLSALRERIQ